MLLSKIEKIYGYNEIMRLFNVSQFELVFIDENSYCNVKKYEKENKKITIKHSIITNNRYYKLIDGKITIKMKMMNKKIIEVNFFENEKPLYTITYGKYFVKSFKIRDDLGNLNCFDGPAYYFFNSYGEFCKERCSYYIHGENYTEEKYKELINNIKNGYFLRNINRYKNLNKIKLIRELAEYYKQEELIEKIDNLLLIRKLESR